jgi:hypothetical protein
MVTFFYLIIFRALYSPVLNLYAEIGKPMLQPTDGGLQNRQTTTLNAHAHIARFRYSWPLNLPLP